MYVLSRGAIKQTKTRHIITILYMHHRCAVPVIYHGTYVSLFHIIHAKIVQNEKRYYAFGVCMYLPIKV